MQRQLTGYDIGRSRRAAWLTLLLTAVVLLTPGAVLEPVLAFAEPVIESLRNWKNSWWPWPVAESSGAGLGVDKIIHASMFAVCGVVVSKAWHETLTISTILLLLLLFGLLTEFAQYFIPGRGMSLGDIAADAVGVLAGISIWHWIGPGFTKPGRGMT